ncbi:MAG: ATP-binding protein [Acidobacteriota bacterium]|nr:ATP-binding protein [Acidobacteriota bacterium]
MVKKIYIHREIEGILKKVVNQFPALVVTGPRQSGKSTLLKEIFSKDYAYISFDDPVTRERAISDPEFFLDSLEEKVIIDEIQYVPQLLSYVKLRIDRKRQERGNFIFTGSQQFNMIKNLGDTLAGRVVIMELLPFSLKEKEKVFKKKDKFVTAQKYFTHSCLRGSFPEIVVYNDIDAELWYSSYEQTYLERDVRTFYNIGNLRDFQRFMQILAARCSQVLNLSSLSSALGVAVNTIKKWISILEATRIIYLLKPYYQNLGKRITKSPKLYFLDNGLLCYLLSLKDRDYLLKGPMAGALFENFCVQETIKTIFNQGKTPKLYYIRTHNGLEIDMLIEKKGQLFPVEYKLTKTPTLDMGKSIKRFRKLFSRVKIMPGRIISMSDKNIPLARDLSVQSIDDYLKWMRKIHGAGNHFQGEERRGEE